MLNHKPLSALSMNLFLWYVISLMTSDSYVIGAMAISNKFIITTFIFLIEDTIVILLNNNFFYYNNNSKLMGCIA